MLRILVIIFFLVGTINAEKNIVRSTGDRVSLRLNPSIDGYLLGRAMKGEEFIGLESNNGWIAVKAPDYIDAWVTNSFVEDNVITANKLNVRVGPNLNYDVLTVIAKGTEIQKKDQFNNWIKITPPTNSIVWISENYTESILLEAIETESLNTNIVLETNKLINDIEDKVLPEISLELKLEPQGIYVEYEGFLDYANPGLYKLVSDSGDIICLIRGKKYQLDPLVNKKISISGKEYYIYSSSLAVVQPEKIKIDSSRN